LAEVLRTSAKMGFRFASARRRSGRALTGLGRRVRFARAVVASPWPHASAGPHL